MEKSILGMVGGEKPITPHYGIKAENTGCYIGSKGFIEIEVNGVRFSNIGEMLRYMNKQRTQLLKAKELIKKFLGFVNNEVEFDPEHPQEHTDLWNELCEQAERFISELERHYTTKGGKRK